MGYSAYISLEESNFFISKQTQKYFLQDKGMTIEEFCGNDYINLEFGYDKFGNIISANYTSDKYKSDYENQYQIVELARYLGDLEDYSHLEFIGEDGERWRIVFKDGNVFKAEPKIVWNY